MMKYFIHDKIRILIDLDFGNFRNKTKHANIKANDP